MTQCRIEYVFYFQNERNIVMKVQRVRLPETDRLSWLVLDDHYSPIEPILSYLRFLHDLDRSPNTIRATAYHLKLYWVYLRDTGLDWTEVDVAHLAAFITWLRQPETPVNSIEAQPARRSNATINLILSSVHGLYDYHMRIGTMPELPLSRFLMAPNRRYKSFLYGIAKAKPVRSRVVAVKPEQRRPKVLTRKQVEALLDACTHARDRFLLALLFETGMRIGQVLGLKHADISVEEGEIQVVPREDNPNGARAKTRSCYSIPEMHHLMGLYTDYLINDLSALKADSLPDYVFVNLWEGQIGSPMTYQAVRSLMHRLCKKTGIEFTPHMFRHTRATTWLRDEKLSAATVARLLGHSSTQTTQDIYLQLTKKDLSRALKHQEEVGDTHEQ
jgi:integrase/recombinase XerD